MKKNANCKIWLNGRIVPDSKAKVSIWDRGFLYGDGVYETVRVYNGRIFRSEGHWKRLRHSLAGLRIAYQASDAQITRACLDTARANGIKEGLVRITVTRGEGEVGYDPSTCGKPTVVVLALPVRGDLTELWRGGVKIALVKVRRNHPGALNPAIKHTNCLNGILAKIESLKSKAFEGVFLNLDGYLAEGTISNIFVVKGSLVKTPALDCGILDGVTRGATIEVARKLGYTVNETRIRPFELYGADEAFLTSTTMEVMPIVQVDRKKIGTGFPGRVTAHLQEHLKNLIRKELKF